MRRRHEVTDKDVKRIGQVVTRFRNQLMMSQETLARMCDLNIRTIRAIEEGRQQPEHDTLYRIADILGVEPFEIVGNLYDLRENSVDPSRLRVPEGVGQRIRGIRLERRISQSTLAQLAGINPNAVGEIETGNYRTTYGTLQKLADALGVNTKVLLG